MRMLAATIISLFLAGCAGLGGMAIPSQIAPPSSRVMVPPEQLQPVHVGDDLVHAMAELRAKYGREALKLTQLQKYVKKLTTKAKE